MNIFQYFKSIISFHPKPKSLIGLSGIQKTDALFHNLVAEQKVPGISVTIVKDAETLLQKGYGFSDLENKVSVDSSRTIFRIASISKCITGLAFGKMVEEGILDWDDSLYKHVPYYPKKGYDFTLRQLASHTAGIRGYRGKEFALNQPFTIKESIKVFKNDPLVFEPGKGYLYNSFDFVLLSLAMEEASGIPFEDYVREKVLAPLGLTNTFTPCQVERSRDLLHDKNSNEVSTRLDLRCSQFYTKNATGFRKAVNVNNFYKLAGGGYLSTSEDIAKMGQAILNQRLLKKQTYEQLLTAQTVHDKSTFYGLGFQVSQDSQGRPFIGHVGSSVGAYTNLFVNPKEKLVSSILINCTDPKIQTDLDKAYESISVESIA